MDMSHVTWVANIHEYLLDPKLLCNNRGEKGTARWEMKGTELCKMERYETKWATHWKFPPFTLCPGNISDNNLCCCSLKLCVSRFAHRIKADFPGLMLLLLPFFTSNPFQVLETNHIWSLITYSSFYSRDLLATTPGDSERQIKKIFHFIRGRRFNLKKNGGTSSWFFCHLMSFIVSKEFVK